MVRSLNGQGAAVRQGSRWREKRQDSLTVRAFDVGPAPALSAPSAPSAPSAVPSDGFTYGGGRGACPPSCPSRPRASLEVSLGPKPKSYRLPVPTAEGNGTPTFGLLAWPGWNFNPWVQFRKTKLTRKGPRCYKKKAGRWLKNGSICP